MIESNSHQIIKKKKKKRKSSPQKKPNHIQEGN